MAQICPLLMQPQVLSNPDLAKCREEACAWYVHYENPGIPGTKKDCAIPRIAYGLHSISMKTKL
jgi:hypothetical protein